MIYFSCRWLWAWGTVFRRCK